MSASRKQREAEQQKARAEALEQLRQVSRDCSRASAAIADPTLLGAVLHTLDLAARLGDEIEAMPATLKGAVKAAWMLYFSVAVLDHIATPPSPELGIAAPIHPWEPLAQALLMMGAARAVINAANSTAAHGRAGGAMESPDSIAAEMRRWATNLAMPSGGQLALKVAALPSTKSEAPDGARERQARRVLAKLRKGT